MDVSAYRNLLRPFFDGAKVLGIGGHVASQRGFVKTMRELGADPLLLLAPGVGAGEVPDRRDASWLSFDVQGTNAVDGIRRYEALLANLPGEARDLVERFDPESRALAVGLIIFSALPDVAGRRRFGARPAASLAFEDKVVIDAFWDRAGVARAPSQVVSCAARELRAAARTLDTGAGTVWAADAREGPHGGAVSTHWVRNEHDAQRAFDALVSMCDRVRVMPFLDGIPCSIHGIVFAHGEAVFRPVELLTLRRAERSALVYAGAATFWKPADEDAAAMRDVARRVAARLRNEIDFRGPFTVDGVLTADGFLPTELNPRVGFGLLLLESSLPELPLALLGIAACEADLSEVVPPDLERLVCAAVDAAPRGGARTLVPRRCTESESLRVAGGLGALRAAQPGDDVVGTLSLGPSVTGGFLTFEPAGGAVEPDASLAPWAAEAFALADRELETGLGPLSAAPSLR